MQSYVLTAFPCVLALSVHPALPRNRFFPVLISHDVEFCAQYADRTGLFFQGNVVTSEESKKFFAGNNFYTTAANRMARNYFPNAVTVEDVVKAINQTEEEAVSC